jgi:digeranylgeranylglycerophospholipid reductase
MKEVLDAIVVGSGPCGSFSAWKLAQLGANVRVYEEHKEIGVPCHCAGHLSIKGLSRLRMYPLPSAVVENTYRGASFFSPTGKRFKVYLDSPVTCAVDRTLFDRYLAEKAQNHGATFCMDSRVDNLIIERGAVKGVVVSHQGSHEKVYSRIVVDAEGISSRLLRQTRLRTLDAKMLVNGIEAEAENVKNAGSDTVEVFFGKEYAPGFYAWLMPKKDGKTKIGLAAKGANPIELLQNLITKHPVALNRFRGAKIIRTKVHPITLGGPITKAYSDGFLAVGDAASQVKPTTGGGVVFGMTCAAIAAEVASEAVRQNDVSSDFLRTYQEKCNEALGFDTRMMVRMRRTLDRTSDDRLDSLIDLCAKLGLEKTLKNVKEIDLQGRTLLHVLRSPRMFAALGYFFFAYFFANL